MSNFIEKTFWTVVRTLEHNEHYITVNILGMPIKACARCLGSFLGALVAFFIITPFMTLGPFDFASVFILSWILAGFAIVDWATVKAKLREGGNTVRFVTGYLLNIGGMIYLLLLPIPFLFRIASLLGYGLVFLVIQYIVKCKEHGLSLKNPIRQNLATITAATIPLTIGTSTCGKTGGCNCACCPCGNMCSCFCSPIGMCVCIGCPGILIMKLIMDRASKPPKSWDAPKSDKKW